MGKGIVTLQEGQTVLIVIYNYSNQEKSILLLLKNLKSQNNKDIYYLQTDSFRKIGRIGRIFEYIWQIT